MPSLANGSETNPSAGRRVCVSVCYSVCKSTCISRKPHARTSPSFSLHGAAAIRYVLPVFWMTSCFHTTGVSNARIYCNSRNCSIDSHQSSINDTDEQVVVVGCTPGAKSATYDCLVLLPRARQRGRGTHLHLPHDSHETSDKLSGLSPPPLAECTQYQLVP